MILKRSFCFLSIIQLALFTSCINNFTISNMAIEPTSNICQKALVLFSNKEFAQWNGIPSSCSANDVFSIFKPNSENHSTSILGNEYIRTSYKVCLVENYTEPIRVWFTGNEIVKIEVQYVNLSQNNLEAIIQSLGEPVDKFDYYLNSVLLVKAEWVFPERGISLFLNGDHKGLVKLAVYHSISLDEYMKKIRVQPSPAREFPLKS